MASLKEIIPFNEENKEGKNILDIPIELLIIIFKFIELPDGIRLLKTCKWFNEAVKDSFCSTIYEIDIYNGNYNKLNNILKDIKVYKKQNFKITLENIPELTDVSALGSVHSLELIDCPNITDVSALGSVHSLILKYCDGIKDVSALGSVHSLQIWRCPNIVKRY